MHLTEGQHQELHDNTSSSKLNWLRAAVLGANDGIVSISGLVVGVAAASTNRTIILATGIAGISAGALSMAVGEFVSVSSQRDSERAMLKKEEYELKHYPEQELEELTQLYQARGLSRKTAEKVAKELTEKDAFKAHVDIELGIDPDDLTNPWHAAYASALSFLAGAMIPLVVILLAPTSWRIPATFIAVLLALALTGYLSAYVGNAKKRTAIIRVVAGGALAMIITFGIGKLFGVSGI